MAPPETQLSPAQERRSRLVALVAAQGFCTVAELADALGVSEMTVRRDARQLMGEGRMRSVHGGVTMLPAAAIGGTDFHTRAARNGDAKKAIARKVLELLPESGAVAFDAGTTTHEVAQLLRPELNLQVVTASVPVINTLLGRDGFDVISLGGTLHQKSQSFAGPMTVAAIGELRLRTLLLAASGLTGEGVYCGNHFDAVSKRALVEVADEVILLADSDKFETSAMVRACSLSDVDVFVTDDRLPVRHRDALRQHGVEVITVPVEEKHAIA
ncbi:DeoR/GlpR family DNA-binding transcription regulator [Amycolatopsis sp. FDAARGOS 1241]|uniref:DeoR/GlpR family DNA-binding transcription regulator n=1 Tax=Amycolatopsis sp. FDAARGOS 1241 TaxID=2778070 RepID=UPI0019525EA9|nr:DeoR/GlpR family DNA-binding transcription regulator [Amycolatopsis sp. FDAARGOS 1241]QRP43427.1 DeoR/GlpR transcriptional regulator [Amycolatopsis sp. FDAARGOS 1241]